MTERQRSNSTTSLCEHGTPPHCTCEQDGADAFFQMEAERRGWHSPDAVAHLTGALEKYANEESWTAMGFYKRYREVPGHLFIGTRTQRYEVMQLRILEEDRGKAAREALLKFRSTPPKRAKEEK